jgi:hypothetical protein
MLTITDWSRECAAIVGEDKMNIFEAIKSGKIDRLVSYDMKRWMFWADETFLEPNRWVVLEKRGNAGGSKTLIATENEEDAVAVLIGEEE